MIQRRWYLFRHGETDYNQKRCFYGSRDVSLNANGIAQAESLRPVMKAFAIDALYTSSLRRSQETAQLIFPYHSIQPLKTFNERDFGLWEGLTADEIQNQFSKQWEAWLQNPFDITPAKAEPFSHFQERVWQQTKELTQKTRGNLALVTHLGVIRLIYQYLIDQETDFWTIEAPQGDALVLEETADGTWTSALLRSRLSNENTN